MARVKNKNSKLEIMFRKELWAKGFRYRKNVAGQFGKPDIVLSKYKTVIFIDSCFWHFCPIHGQLPKSNAQFWKNKLKNNSKRNETVNKHYSTIRWHIIRVWEHDLVGSNLNKKIKMVIRILSTYAKKIAGNNENDIPRKL